MRTLSLVITLVAAATTASAACAQAIDDPFNDYLQRSDKIFLGAGNANDVNAAVHTITPWPPYAGNTHIHVDGRQSVDSVERMYRTPDPFERQGTPAAGAAATGQQGSSVNLGLPPPAPVQALSNGY